MVKAGLLQHILKEIRDREIRKPGESIDCWASRTWKMALLEYEIEKPEQEKDNEDDLYEM